MLKRKKELLYKSSRTDALATCSFFYVKIEARNYKLIYRPEFENFRDLGKIWIKFADIFTQN